MGRILLAHGLEPQSPNLWVSTLTIDVVYKMWTVASSLVAKRMIPFFNKNTC